MDFFETVERRKSYRDTFKNTPISREDLIDIVEAGMWAPSGCNLQTPGFIAVDDANLARELAEIYDRPWALTAPAAILILTKETMSPSGVSYHIHDYSAAIENILLAITAKGFASVWIEGQIRGEKAARMGKILNVPKDLTVAVYLPVGVPEKPFVQATKKPWNERVWFNRYQN